MTFPYVKSLIEKSLNCVWGENMSLFRYYVIDSSLYSVFDVSMTISLAHYKRLKQTGRIYGVIILKFDR